MGVIRWWHRWAQHESWLQGLVLGLREVGIYISSSYYMLCTTVAYRHAIAASQSF